MIEVLKIRRSKMKKRLWAVALSVAVSSANADNPKLDKETLTQIEKNTKILQLPNLSVVDGIDKGNIYFLKVKSTSPRGSQMHKAYLDKKTGMVFVGEAYDKEGKVLVFPKEKQIIEEGVAFSYGSGKKELYLVTDPQCPYCTKFEKASKGKLDEYTVHVIFFPLGFHKNAPAMIEWIMQGKDDVDKKARMDKIMLKGSVDYQSLIKDKKKPFVYSNTTKEMIERSMRAVEELEVRGTPSLYNEKLESVNWTQLFQSKK
jgi:thiol:disulfide interchange protein DsbC